MGQGKYYHARYQPKTFELVCPNDGPSFFDTTYDNCFFVVCHMQGCRWEEPNPDYKPVIDDFEMLDLIGKRWVSIRANVEPWIETPDKALSKKYSQEAINAKMEELDHRGLLDYGVSLRTAWLTKQGEALLDSLRTK